MRSKRKKRQYGNVLTPYLFILPNFLIFVCFIVIPMIFGFSYSLFKWDGIGEMVFIGLDNFKAVFSDYKFYEVMKNTIGYVIIVVPLIFATSLIVAYLLIKEIKLKGFFRAAIYWPTMISMILVGVTWKWILGDSFGILNYLLVSMGFEPIKWLTVPFFAMLSLVVATLWNRIGFYMVTFISGLQSIPVSYYEACEMDGATSFEKFRYITFPLLKPTSFLVFTLATIDAFKAYGIVFSLTGGGPNSATTFIVQSIYQEGFHKNRVGYASALSVVLFIFLGTLTVIQYLHNKGGEVN